mmetsp:Transcript_1944/g.3087  ORF Transcript_1944/g.3087 Transcript_1944/m.3087 type:complete len:172 (+) Transcript_1944:3-518(+)
MHCSLIIFFSFILLGVYGSPANYTLKMISISEGGEEFTVYNLAIADINANPNILPNTVLDFSFIPNFYNSALAVEAIIEYSNSNDTLVIGNLLTDTTAQSGIVGGVYGVTQLSATVSGTFLSDKLKYPYFTSLASPTIEQTLAITDVILYYSQFGIGWKDVALICTSEEWN